MKLSSSNRQTLVIALVAVVLLLSLIAYDNRRQGTEVPAILKYAPASSENFVFSTNLSESWKGLVTHSDLFFSESGTDLAETGKDIKSFFDKLCFVPSKPQDFSQLGLDPNGMTMLAFNGSINEPADWITVLPLLDKSLFQNFVASTELEAGIITLKGSSLDKEVVSFRVQRIGEPEYGRLCANEIMNQVISTQVVDSPPNASNSLELRYIPDWFSSGRLQISCRAVYRDGSDSQCSCKLRPGDFEVENGAIDCSEPLVILPVEEEAIKFIATKESIQGLHNDIEIEKIALDDVLFVFQPDNFILITDSENTLLAAISQQDDNLAVHSNSDRVHQSLSLPRQVDFSSSPILFGSVFLSQKLGSQPLNFGLRGNYEKLDIGLSLDIPRPGLQFIERLISSNNLMPFKSRIPEVSQASLLFNETDVEYYLRFLNQYVDDYNKNIEELVGNFSVAIREVEKLNNVDGIGLHLIGLREGIPELLLVIHFSEQLESREQNDLEAQLLINRLQNKMRHERDLTILSSVIKKYESVLKTKPTNINSILNHSERFILPEDFATWGNYSLQGNAHIEDLTILSEKLFQSEVYKLEYNNQTIRYLLPPVTDNDLLYRFNNEDLDEHSLTQLKQGKNRLASVYIRDDSVLLVGSDAETLKSVLNQDLYQKPASMYQQLNFTDEGRKAPKIVLFLRPNWLVFQGKIHPNVDIKEDVHKMLLDFEHYQVILLTIDPRSDRDGLVGTIQFVR